MCLAQCISRSPSRSSNGYSQFILRSISRSSSCALLHPVALVLLVSIPFPEDALLPKFAKAVSVLPDVSSELLSTIPLTFAPGELPSGTASRSGWVFSSRYQFHFGSVTDFSSATGALHSPPVHFNYMAHQILANQTSRVCPWQMTLRCRKSPQPVRHV